MDPSFCDLEFFDFKGSSDEEIKEIQAILKGPKSEGCVKLPWENSVKYKCSGSLPQNEGSETESAKDVGKETLQVLTTTHSVLPPVMPLPPALETFVTLPTTVGPYHNTPYFVSRTLPYLRTYPPMGMPIFACPLPGAGEASPYGFVPMTPADTEAGFKRQSSRRGSSKKRLGSDSPENANPYPEMMGCPTSVPLVPLSVPPSTFVGGNLSLHGYPPGLHTSPTMYYVPVFNHPYGGYIQASGPPMMLPVNVATTDMKCPPLVSEETLHTNILNESPPRDINRGVFELPKDNRNSCELTQDDSVGHLESPQNNPDLTSPQTRDLEEMAAQSENDCQSGEELLADNLDLAEAISTYVGASTVEDSTCIVRSDSKSNTLPDVGDTAAKTNVPEPKEKTDNKSKSPLSEPPNKDCFPETENECLKEAVVPLGVPPTDASNPVVVQSTPVVTALPRKVASSKDEVKIVSLSEAAKPVVHLRPSKCWADLFKGPSEVNGFENPPEPNGKSNCDLPEPRKIAMGKGQPPRVKRDVSNGKVPSSNSLY